MKRVEEINKGGTSVVMGRENKEIVKRMKKGVMGMEEGIIVGDE